MRPISLARQAVNGDERRVGDRHSHAFLRRPHLFDVREARHGRVYRLREYEGKLGISEIPAKGIDDLREIGLVGLGGLLELAVTPSLSPENSDDLFRTSSQHQSNRRVGHEQVAGPDGRHRRG